MEMPGEKKPAHSKRYGIFLKGAKTAIFALIAVLVVFFVIFLSQKAYFLGYETASYEPEVSSESEAKEVTITINARMSASDIGKLLIEEGLIDESLEAFLLQDMLSGLHGEYVPGTYTLNNSLTVDEMLQIICTEPEDENDN
jgi:cell division protein YceG involved in septum cleavage